MKSSTSIVPEKEDSIITCSFTLRFFSSRYTVYTHFMKVSYDGPITSYHGDNVGIGLSRGTMC